MRHLTRLISLLVASQVAAQGEPNVSGGELIPEQAVFDVAHYDLAVKVDPATRTIQGTLRMRATITDETDVVALHLDGRLRVQRVAVGGASVQFTHRDGLIRVPLPVRAATGAVLEVLVTYGGEPREAPSPPWQGGFTWEESGDGHPWITTTCQGEGADLWWPCKDHPSDKPDTMDLAVTIPAELFCVSNGTLASDTQNEDGTRTVRWHIANPISNYNVALNIGRFDRLDAEIESVAGGTFPVYFWCLPENRKKAEHILPQFLEHVRFLEGVCGPYPFRNEKYGVVETPHLGMEHQTCIAYGNDYRRGPFDYDWLHLHELSHEWWANLVTCRDWKDMWVHEGFGTYMQALYIERHHGPEGYRIEMGRTRSEIQNQRPVAPFETRDSHQIYFRADGASDSDIYYKGAWILHTLRWVIGDDAFFRAVRRVAYPKPKLEAVTDGTQVHFVDTEDVRKVFEAVSERDLGWFFAVYLRQPALPELVVERRGEHRVALRWQVPDDLPFPMPVPVEVDGELRRVATDEGEVVINVGAAGWRIDPDDWLLRQQ